MSDANSAENANGPTAEDQLSQLVAYDERLRTEYPQTAHDEVLEHLDPALTKAMRALRDVLGRSTPTESLDTCTGLEGDTPTQSVPFPMQPVIPDRFQLISELGSGGFGIVYQAYDTWLKRQVAIKFLRPELLSNPTLRQRFLRESRAAARLSHPFIVRVLEVSEAAGSTWQVCELVEGAPLSQHIASSPLEPKLAARFIRDLVDAVAHAHASSVLHRDIKPDNILVDCQPGQSLETATLRLTDFGLARLTDVDATAISHTGMLVGTPRYMAPEQLSGKVDEHGTGTDIYAIGIVLYELLTSKNPFGDVSSLQERLAKIQDPIPYVRKLSPLVPRDLATICHKCLEHRPERRYLSAVDLRDDLDRFLRGDPTHARPLPLHETLWRWSMRHRTSASILCILIIGTALFLAQTLRNNAIYRQQNTQLSEVNAQLTSQEHQSRELASLADKLRAEAISKQERFVDLAWKKGIREAYTAWDENNYAEASELLVSLAESHPNKVSRVEWRLLRADVDKHVKPLLDLPCAIHEVRAIPNSQQVAAAGDDGSVYIVDVITGKLIGRIETGIRSLNALAVSPDGRMLVTGGSANLATRWAFPKIYDVKTLQLIRQLPGQATTIESLEFSADGRQVACGSRYSTVKIYSLDSEVVTELPSKRRNVWLSASPKSNSFAAQGTSNSWLMSDPRDSGEHQVQELNFELVCANWLPSGKGLVLASRFDHGTKFVTSETPARNFARGTASSFSEAMAITASDNLVAASLSSGEVLMWHNDSSTEHEPAQPLGVWQLSKSPVYSIALLDTWLVAATHDGKLTRILVPQSKRDSTYHQEPEVALHLLGNRGSQSVTWQADGQHILMGTYNGEFRLVDLAASGRPVNTTNDPLLAHICSRQHIPVDAQPGQSTLIAGLPPNDGPAQVASFSDIAGNQRAWVTTRHSSIAVIRGAPGDAQQPIVFQTNPPHKDGILAVAFSRDASHLAWTGSDGNVHVACLTEPEPTTKSQKLKGRGGCLDWSWSGDRLALSGELPILELDPVSGDMTEIIDYGIHTLCLAYNHQGQIVSGHRDGTIRFVDPATRRTHALQVHPAEVRSLRFIDNGRIGLSLDSDANIGVWFANGENIGVIHHDVPCAQGVHAMSPKAWTDDSQAILKILYADSNGKLLLDTWNLSGR